MLVALTALYIFLQNLIAVSGGVTAITALAIVIYWVVTFCMWLDEEGPYVGCNAVDNFVRHIKTTANIILILSAVHLFIPTKDQLNILIGAVIVQNSADMVVDYVKANPAIKESGEGMIKNGLEALGRKFEEISKPVETSPQANP